MQRHLHARPRRRPSDRRVPPPPQRVLVHGTSHVRPTRRRHRQTPQRQVPLPLEPPLLLLARRTAQAVSQVAAQLAATAKSRELKTLLIDIERLPGSFTADFWDL